MTLVKSKGCCTRAGQRVRVERVRVRVVGFLPSDNPYPLSGLTGERPLAAAELLMVHMYIDYVSGAKYFNACQHPSASFVNVKFLFIPFPSFLVLNKHYATHLQQAS